MKNSDIAGLEHQSLGVMRDPNELTSGLTKREHFAASLPHIEVELNGLESLSEVIGRSIDVDDVIDCLKAGAEFEAIYRVIRADAHLAELEK